MPYRDRLHDMCQAELTANHGACVAKPCKDAMRDDWRDFTSARWRRGLLPERVKMHKRIPATSFNVGVFEQKARLSVMAECDDTVVPVREKLNRKPVDQRSAMATDGIFERWSFHSCKVATRCYVRQRIRERRRLAAFNASTIVSGRCRFGLMNQRKRW